MVVVTGRHAQIAVEHYRPTGGGVCAPQQHQHWWFGAVRGRAPAEKLWPARTTAGTAAGERVSISCRPEFPEIRGGTRRFNFSHAAVAAARHHRHARARTKLRPRSTVARVLCATRPPPCRVAAGVPLPPAQIGVYPDRGREFRSCTI